jgi:hypothetical protein
VGPDRPEPRVRRLPFRDYSCGQSIDPLESSGVLVRSIRYNLRQFLPNKLDMTISNPSTGRSRGVRCSGSLAASSTIRLISGFSRGSRTVTYGRLTDARDSTRPVSDPSTTSDSEQRVRTRRTTRDRGLYPGVAANYMVILATRPGASRSLGGSERPSLCIRYRGMYFMLRTNPVRPAVFLPSVTSAARLAIDRLGREGNTLRRLGR